MDSKVAWVQMVKRFKWAEALKFKQFKYVGLNSSRIQMVKWFK